MCFSVGWDLEGWVGLDIFVDVDLGIYCKPIVLNVF